MLKMDRLAERCQHKVDNFLTTYSTHTCIVGRRGSWPENINNKFIISLSRAPYTVLLPEYGQVGQKIST